MPTHRKTLQVANAMQVSSERVLPYLAGATMGPGPYLPPTEPPTPNRFEIKLHPYLKTALKSRADQRGLDLSAYIQEVLWKHCPDAEDLLKIVLALPPYRPQKEDTSHTTPEPESF